MRARERERALERVGQGQAVWWVVMVHLQARHQAWKLGTL